MVKIRRHDLQLVSRWVDDHCKIFSIFYNVDPSDIRKQKGEFGKAFNRLVKNLKGEKMGRVKIWRKALTQVANIAGEDSRNR